MKIFLCSKNSNNFFRFGKVISVLFAVLLAVALISQLYSYVSDSSVPASSSNITPSVRSGITLTARGNFMTDDVVIYVNGEETARFVDAEAQIVIDRPSAVEVMCVSDADVTVSVTPSDDIQILADRTEVDCRRGMNFICRCYRTQ